MEVLVQARARRCAPPADVLAQSISVICRAPAPGLHDGAAASPLPSARARWLAQIPAERRDD
eukprot:1449207-Pyramimonas_sp.AAC.1